MTLWPPQSPGSLYFREFGERDKEILWGNISTYFYFLREYLAGQSLQERECKWARSKEGVMDERTTDVPLDFTIYINMLTVSSDASIQKYHWQLLSVHLWAYYMHPTHDVNDVWRLATPPGSTSPTFFEQRCGLILLCPTRTDKCNCCETGPTVLYPYLRRKTNCLQMSLQRQHFLLSYLTILSVGSARVWTCNLPLSRPVFSQLS